MKPIDIIIIVKSNRNIYSYLMPLYQFQSLCKK
jgi:hypothetical protein